MWCKTEQRAFSSYRKGFSSGSTWNSEYCWYNNSVFGKLTDATTAHTMSGIYFL